MTIFIEVYQNCNIFNHGAFEYATDRQTKADNVVELEHGKPLIFGKNREKGIRLNGMEPEIVILGENGVTEADLLVHDEKAPEPSLAYLLSRMRNPDFPEPIGVFRCVDRPQYDKMLNDQIAEARRAQGEGDLEALFHSGETWSVDLTEQLDEAPPAPAPAASDVEKHLVKRAVSELNPAKPVIVAPQTPVAEVLNLLVQASIGCVLVVEDEELVGVFSERDALMRLNTDAADLGDRPISDYMSSSPESLEVDDKIAFALHMMDLGGFRHVPLLKDGRVDGIISVRDILRYITADLVAAEDDA